MEQHNCWVVDKSGMAGMEVCPAGGAAPDGEEEK